MAMSRNKLRQLYMEHCDLTLENLWLMLDIIIVVLGVGANLALLWIFLRERKSLSVSQVLGVNLVAMDLIYLSFAPFILSFDPDRQVNRTDPLAIIWQESQPSYPEEIARDVFNMLNLVGCPMLLACMCIERYLAVVRPVLYLRARKWEYRLAVSVVVWTVTLSACLAAGLVDTTAFIMIPTSIFNSCLFIIMLACLGGVIRSLRQQSPALTTCGNQTRAKSPLKRQAVINVLAVVVPAVISYLPLLVMSPVFLCTFYHLIDFDHNICTILGICLRNPKFGVFVGPLFYLSKARQMCSLGGIGKKGNG